MSDVRYYAVTTYGRTKLPSARCPDDNTAVQYAQRHHSELWPLIRVVKETRETVFEVGK
jgi:hypothetical protein